MRYEEVEASQSRNRVPYVGDPVSALLTYF